METLFWIVFAIFSLAISYVVYAQHRANVKLERELDLA